MSWAVQRLNDGIVVTKLESADKSRLWSIHDTEKEALEAGMSAAMDLIKATDRQRSEATSAFHKFVKRFYEL